MGIRQGKTQEKNKKPLTTISEHNSLFLFFAEQPCRAWLGAFNFGGSMTIFERFEQWILDIKERLQWFIDETDFTRLFVMLLIILICICSWTMAFMVVTKRVHAETASYYTYDSCKKEGTSGVWTASGERFNENDLTCAMRSREWGAKYKVTNIKNGKSVIVKLNDFGPSKKLWDKGRKVDLSKEAFKRIASLKQGIINVKIERLK